MTSRDSPRTGSQVARQKREEGAPKRALHQGRQWDRGIDLNSPKKSRQGFDGGVEFGPAGGPKKHSAAKLPVQLRVNSIKGTAQNRSFQACEGGVEFRGRLQPRPIAMQNKLPNSPGIKQVRKQAARLRRSHAGCFLIVTFPYDCSILCELRESRNNVQRALVDVPVVPVFLPVIRVLLPVVKVPVVICIGDQIIVGFPVYGILGSGDRREDDAGRREDAASIRVNAYLSNTFGD